MSFSVYRGKNAAATLATAAIYIASLLAVFWTFLPEPGSLFARVVRDFWPLYHSWPQFDLGHRLIFHFGHFPLWNFLSGFGTPMLANLQSAPFHPARLLFLLPFWNVIDVWLLLRVFLSGMLTYGFLRWRGSGWSGATIGGLAWMLTGSVTDYINMHYLDVDLLLPASIWLFGIMARRRSFSPVVWSALLVVLAFLGGNPTSVLYLLIFTTLYYFYTIYRLRGDLRGSWFRFFAAAALSGLAVAALLLPFREFLANSWNYHPRGVGAMALPVRHLLTAFGPEVYSDELHSGVPLLQRIPYLGVVPISLAVFGVLCLRRMGSGASFFAVFAMVFGGLACGMMPFHLLSYLPVLIRTSNFRYAVPEVAFCVALLAGMGWDHLTHWKEARNRILLLPVALTVVSGWLIIAKLSGSAVLPVRGPGLMFFMAVAWSVALVLLRLRRRARWAWPAYFLLLVIWVLEAGIHVRYLPTLAPDRPETFTSLPTGIEQRTLLEGRTYATPGIMYPNLNLVHGVMDIRYLGALYPDRYARFMSVINNFTPEELLGNFIETNYMRILPDRLESPLVDLAGITTIVSDVLLPPNRLVKRMYRNGSVRAPSAHHVFPKKMVIGEDLRMTLYQHPPARVETEAPLGFLLFGIGIDPSRWSAQGDGATFSIYRKEKKRLKRVFVRHVDPAHIPGDRAWMEFAISHPGGKIILETTPGGDDRHDWAGWGEIRTSAHNLSRHEQIQDIPLKVYDNGRSMLGAFVVGKVRVVAGPEESQAALIKGFDFRKMAVVEGADAHLLRIDLGPQDDYQIGLDRMPGGRVRIVARLKNAGVLVLNDGYYPGWRAFVDDRETKIFPADLAFRAVKAPEGKHRIEFIYRPISFRIGLWTSISTILLLGVIIYRIVRERDEEKE